MRSDRRPVATQGNGYGLFPPLLHRSGLPLFATGCDHRVPQRLHRSLSGETTAAARRRSSDATRAALWTPRVWPGAVLVDGEIVGTWRRAHADVTIESSRRGSRAEREAVEAEASGLPLP